VCVESKKQEIKREMACVGLCAIGAMIAMVWKFGFFFGKCCCKNGKRERKGLPTFLLPKKRRNG
jgi:hypothetical protein